MLNFQALPDELILKIFSFSETKDLISCGQVSKRTRRISHDRSLWMTAILEKKIVKTELLEMILRKGCRILNLCHSTILGSFSSNIKSQLRVLNLSQSKLFEENNVLEKLLFSTSSLQHLVTEGVNLTPKMTASICKNGQTLQILNLNRAYLWPYYNYLHEIIKCCQELREVDLADVNATHGLTYEDLEFLAKNISTNVEKLNLSSRSVRLRSVIDDHVKILLGRCNKLKTLDNR
jgi:hypothetical protein